MTELKFFSRFYVDKLYRLVVTTENIDNYKKDKFPIDDGYCKGPTEIFLDDSIILDPNKSDMENSISLYGAVKGLTEVQASDERLWVFLTHNIYWDYMRKRWPIEETQNPISRIRDRYFMRNMNLESITRNGIARLWWYAHLTHDSSRENPFELLEILLSRQDLAVGITERALGASSIIRTGILEFLRANPKIASNEDKTRELIKAINLIGGVKLLPLLGVNRIKEILSTLPSLS
jgi:hypothetical protein